jgi:transcriptional antiterminator NusG
MPEGCNWYALYVKSRHEFATQSELERKGINTYLPSIKRVSQWKDRRKCIDFPLFPGYLFVFVQPHPEAFLSVLKTRGSVTLLSSEPGRPTPVTVDEIDSLKLLIESGNDFDIHPHLQEGSGVKVMRGPLMGAEGTIASKGDQYLFTVNINILGRSVSVKIFADDIEAD